VELLYAPEISIGSEIGGRARHEGASRTGSGEEEAADGLFVSALDANEPERAEAALAAWWASRRKKDGLTAAAWLIHVMNGSHLIVRHAERNGWTLEDIFGETANEAIAFNRLQTAEQGYELLLRLVRGYMQHEEASRPAAARHPAIRTLFAIVQREAEEDLSLNAMAARLALHPFHLSRLFKKETGQAYSEYVTAVRMKRARKLLEVGHKVYEVAVRSGFSDAGNFSKAFSKYWGVSPVSFKSKRS
jgi:two-component system response regulator YesN